MVEREADKKLGDDKNIGAPCVASGKANATGVDRELENTIS